MKDKELTLVTGAPGFAAGWLIADLLASGRRVHGLGLPPVAGPPATYGPFALAGPDPRRSDDLPGTVRYGGSPGEWSFTPCRLEDAATLAAIVTRTAPAEIYHLAAQSSAGLSFEQPCETFATNVEGCLNLLECLRGLPETDRPRLLAVGSCEEYGDDPDEPRTPLAETAALHPVSPYGVSKVTQTLLCLQYGRACGLDVVVARPFSHTGPGHDARFAFPSFARQIARAEAGADPDRLRVGNLEPVRDFLDVRDVTRAYRLLMERGRSGTVYNICSGQALTIRQGLDILLASARAPIAIENDPERWRPADIPYMVGDNTRLTEETGWHPEHDFADTLGELLVQARKESR